MFTKIFNVTIVTKTGLHIGAGNAKIEIGGMDQPVIKDMNGFPYIPASSLKGNIRSLYEVANFTKDELSGDQNGLKNFDGKNYDEVSMFFGKTGTVKENLENLGPTRFIFRDLKLKESLSEQEKEKGLLGMNELKQLRKDGESIYEEKMEVMINRFTGEASKSGPRPIERVPAGTIFEGELIVRFFATPTKELEQENFEKFGEDLSGLKELIENDFLGGQGSRGSGQIEINFEEVKK